jgi:hypothetical protein
MQEAFIHYLWQFQFFDKENLQTAQQIPLQVLAVGQANAHAGADFQNASIFMEGIRWFGSVEIHIKTSDWLAHRHQTDKNYENVILHVVWEDDLGKKEEYLKRQDGSEIPVLVLKNRVDRLLVEKYYALIQYPESPILCTPQLPHVKQITKIAMLDKVLMERLKLKAGAVLKLLEDNKGDWETTTYQWLAQCFGFKVNNEPFLRLSKTLSYLILQKHKDNLLQIEALLLGQAGLLEIEDEKIKQIDSYWIDLNKEYDFLSHKYSLKINQLKPHHWKFLRLRPANFPTIRLAQFAQLLYQKNSLFTTFVQEESYEKLSQFLDVTQSAYWQKHYLFGKESEKKIGKLGKESIYNLIINGVVVLLVTYANKTDNQAFMEKAIHFLEQMPTEKNHILRHWEGVGMTAKNAFDSQALIGLFNYYCKEKKCLQCTIGVSLLKQ